MRKRKRDLQEKKSLFRAGLEGFAKTGAMAAVPSTIFGIAPQHLNFPLGFYSIFSGMQKGTVPEVVPSWPDLETQLSMGPKVALAGAVAGGIYGATKKVLLTKSQNKQEDLPLNSRVRFKIGKKDFFGTVTRHHHQKGLTRVKVDKEEKSKFGDILAKHMERYMPKYNKIEKTNFEKHIPLDDDEILMPTRKLNKTKDFNF